MDWKGQGTPCPRLGLVLAASPRVWLATVKLRHMELQAQETPQRTRPCGVGEWDVRNPREPTALGATPGCRFKRRLSTRETQTLGSGWFPGQGKGKKISLEHRSG